MTARAASLAKEFADLRPRAQGAPGRKGGPGSRGPGAGAAGRYPGNLALRALHASNRSRRRLERKRKAAGSLMAACA